MLILAGVTISIVINAGLFNQANEAAIQVDVAHAREKIQTELLGEIIEKRKNLFTKRKKQYRI